METNFNHLASIVRAQKSNIPVGEANSYKLIASPISTTVVTGKMVTPSSTQNGEVRTSSSNATPESNSVFKIQSVVSLKQSDLLDTSLKNDSLQQLSTNALPPYTASALPAFMLNDKTPNDFHCCSDCGDTFVLKSSLKFHLERRSTLIKFACESCRATQIFYNRCSLLSHIRSHADKGETSDMHKAIVNPLPRVFMDGIHTDFVNNLEDELNSTEDGDESMPTNLLEFSIKEVEDVEGNNDTVVESKVETVNVIPVKVKCYDCDQEFESKRQRKEHLTNGDKMPEITDKDKTLCVKCKMLCPSACSLKAHLRIHQQISPYICPECGDSPDPYWVQFQAHLKYRCFHFSRAIGFKCPVCKRVVRTRDALSKHMELHTERYAKCDSCPRAFKSPAAFIAHKKINHDGKVVHYNIIYKCALCDVVFLSNDRMLSHRDDHLKDQVCEYIFNCMQCGKALQTKLALVEHLRSCHQKTYKHYVCEDAKVFRPKSNTVETEYRGRIECILCYCTFHSFQGYSVHMTRSHINSKIPCNFCFIVMPNRKEMIAHGKKHLRNGGYLCLLCHNKKFEEKNVLITHLLTHVQRLKFSTFCPVCDEPLQTASTAMEHLRSEHFLRSINERLPNSGEASNSVQNAPKESAAIACHFCRVLFDNDASLQKHLINEHNVAANDKAKTASVTEEPPAKRQRPSEDTCAKCNFKTSNRAEFKKHILEHKTNKSTFQCQDCGLCFVVQPSLTKHLKIVHKIHDVKKYIEEEGTNFSPDKTNSTDSSNLNALDCSVCFTSFPTETALKTHMRSHGMAFIQAKKSITF